MKEIYQQYQSFIEENMEENAKGALAVRDFLTDKNLTYHGNTIRTLQIPKIFTKEDLDRFRKIVSTTYGIFQKVINTYLEDPSYRNLFPFGGELRDLILTPRGYDSVLPIARFDIFYNEENGDFKFCEINTDGTSAMNEDRVLNLALSKNPAHQYVSQSHTFSTFELFDPWVRTFCEIYATYKKRVEHPHVAIVDFLDGVEIAEFYEFQRRFETAGVTCEICEITQLSYHDHHLYSPTGKIIDAVYRRAVTTDLMQHRAEVRPFLEAFKNEDVCVIGALNTQIVHNKWLFHLLRGEETLSLLTAEERSFVLEHIPKTGLLSGESRDLRNVLSDKNRYLIKPLDSYASKGVYAGIDCTQAEWEAHIRTFGGNTYIYQEYCPPYRTANIDFLEKRPAFQDYSNMTGLYVYNGKFSGIYSRLAGGAVISSQYNERDCATLVLRDE